MPEARLEAARKRGLPEGYQFGDAHVTHPAFAGLGRERALALVRALRHSEPPAAPFVGAWEDRTGFPFTPQGVADWVDARVSDEVYGSIRPLRLRRRAT